MPDIDLQSGEVESGYDRAVQLCGFCQADGLTSVSIGMYMQLLA